ncbi:MAG: Arm DNA-binding domain-containing protein [Rhodoglobus sp.]
MGSISAYQTTSGKRYWIIYRRPDHLQTQKRGFKTKRDAELFLAKTEIDKSRGAYINPSKSGSTCGWRADRTSARPRGKGPGGS